MLLTGDNLTAQEAYTFGLINKIVPQTEVLKHTKDLAMRIASRGKWAIRQIMRAVREAAEKSLDEALDFETRLFGEICQTQDMKEGVTAFLEKRQPQFKDQ